MEIKVNNNEKNNTEKIMEAFKKLYKENRFLQKVSKLVKVVK